MFIYNYINVPKSTFSIRFLSIYLASVALLIVSSKIQVPMIPVPITFQTVAILLIPALFGLKLSMSALTSWLALGAMGLPVFAGNIALPGLTYFMGPTGGYFIGFIMASIATAFVIHTLRVIKIMPITFLFLTMHALILFTGWIWLSYGLPNLGAEKAWITGVLPFLTGAILKTAILTALVYPVVKKKV